MKVSPWPIGHRHRPGRRHQLQRERGAGIVEPLIFVAMLALAIAGATTLLLASNRSFLITRQVSRMDAAIDDNLNLVDQMGDRYTCCAGVCQAPQFSNNGVADSALNSGETGSNQSCATSDPRNPSYLFPQSFDGNDASKAKLKLISNSKYDPAKPNDSTNPPGLCDKSLATHAGPYLLTNLQTALATLPQPDGATRSVEQVDPHNLRVTYRANDDNRIVRVTTVVPPIALFCP